MSAATPPPSTVPINANIEPFEKNPLASKKFLAFLISEVAWKLTILMMVVMLFWMSFSIMYGTVLIVSIVASVFLEVGFILGQASLDKLIRMAQVTANALPKDTIDDAKQTAIGLVEKATGADD